MEIRTEKLTKIFENNGEKIIGVKDLDIFVEKGSIVGLLGPNGAGKTTTVRLLSTVYRPTSGSAYIGDYSILENDLEIRRHIGVATENPSIYGRLTGRRNLEFYGSLYDMDSKQITDRINNLAEEFELSDAIDRPVNGYSKGMKQKLSVAKALLHEPNLLILDEPWSGLSPVATRDLREKIKSLQNRDQRTILITTHNLAQAEMIVDKILIIADGSLMTVGSPEELRKKYHIDKIIDIKINPGNSLKQLENIEDDLQGINDVSYNNSSIQFKVKDYSVTPEIVKYMVNRDISIHQVLEIVPSLEEVYLGLVKEG